MRKLSLPLVGLLLAGCPKEHLVNVLPPGVRVDTYAQQAAAGRQALAAHMNAAGGRRGEAWFRGAIDLKKKVEREHFELDVTLKALQELLGSLPDAEKRLAPHAALLLEERLRVQAREQARADAERAAAELEKVRRLAEAR